MAITATDNSQSATPTYSLPQVDNSAYNYSTPTGSNPYGQGTPQYDLYNSYTSNLGRAPEAGIIDYRTSQLGATPESQQLSDIANSPEAQTYGRARNTVNPTVDAQILGYQQQAQLARQAGMSQLGNLGSQFDTQRNSLLDAYHQNLGNLDYQLNQAKDQTDFAAQRYQQQINPAILAARESAARSGLLNSTVAIDRVNLGLLPIQQNLANLAQQYQTQAGNIDQQRTNYGQSYNRDLNTANSTQAQQARSLQDQVTLQLQQYADQAAQANATRQAQIASQAGNFGDVYRQYQLQQGQLGVAQQQVQSQSQQFAQQLAEQQREFAAKQAMVQSGAYKGFI